MTDETTPDDHDDDELELEPIDPEILAHQEQLAKRKVQEAEASVDVDQLYREAEESQPLELGDFEKFRFTTRHLLILTALLSMVMALCKVLDNVCTGLFITAVLGIAGGYYFVHRRERQRAKELEQRRREVEERFAARRTKESGEPTEEIKRAISVDVDTAWAAAQREASSFKFSFSLKEFFVAFTAAAVILSLLWWMSPGQLAVILGMTALLGLIVHALGFDPPQYTILVWWLLMVLYLILGTWSSFAPDAQASVAPSARDSPLASLAFQSTPSLLPPTHPTARLRCCHRNSCAVKLFADETAMPTRA